MTIFFASINPGHAALVTVEAESGTLGTNFTIGNVSGTQYISNTNNNSATTPDIPGRVASYSVTFPQAGTYALYARVRVGAGGAANDSFFYGNGLGSGFNIKSPTTDADWITVNGVNIGGFTNSSDVVTGSGSAGINVWKWIKLSEYTGTSGEPPIMFTVPAGSLTQTFQIGGREAGFDIDKFAFGTVDYNFTVANLDAGMDGKQQPSVDGSCTVQWDDVRQVIDGFGASSAWRSTWSTALANMLFSTNSGNGFGRNGAAFSYTGVGLSLLRTRIAPGGTTVENSIMQMAQARGARVWSAPWSPAPANQFKSNGSVNGGSFIGNAANYEAYAGQLARYVVNMKNQFGINLYAISIQNEPDANVTTYESCNWTAQQIHDFVPYLHSALAASNVGSTKIMLPESQNWTDPGGLRLTTMNDPTTAALVDIIANHNYVPNNAIGDQNPPAAINNYGKALWQTEVSKLSGDDSGIEDGLYWARRVHQFMTVAQANAWHYWWLCAYGTSNEGLCDINDVPAKRMYTLGNFSRFVRPGFHRIVVTNTTGPLLVSAYKNLTNGGFAVVCVNESTANVTQTFNLDGVVVGSTVVPWVTSATASLSPQPPISVNGSQFNGLVPAKSVVTFVGQAAPPNSPPSLASIADLVTNVGQLVTVTNVADDGELPPQTLVFDLLTGPTNATLNTSNGVFTWKPLVSQADMTNLITIKVTDNGTPSLSDTNSYRITVNPLSSPVFGPIEINNDQMSLAVTGSLGPDYTLLTSTNFTDWEALAVTNPALMPITFIITNSANPQRFYRIQLGP